MGAVCCVDEDSSLHHPNPTGDVLFIDAAQLVSDEMTRKLREQMLAADTAQLFQKYDLDNNGLLRYHTKIEYMINPPRSNSMRPYPAVN